MSKKNNKKSKTPEDFLKILTAEKRGKLKVYLGSAAGVGKTYRMLLEGKQLQQNNVDVVVGYMEPHERPETIAQAQGLEVVPPKMVQHGNIQLKEMDLDAVLKRKPAVVLVDELAHTNAPGSKNTKRYQDVQGLLSVGIDVITTLNIQHLESLYNDIEDATGIKVTERIPDDIVGEADLVVNVDLEAEDLIARLKAGKIYKLDRITTALNNFFSLQNLTRLREISLSETANFLDKRQREKFEASSKPSALNKVMVRIRGSEPNFEAVLRRASRLASQLNAQWYVVYVSTLKEEVKVLSPNRDTRKNILETAEKMGAETIILKDENVAEALIQFARANGITHLVQSHSLPRKFWDFFHKSVTESLVQNLPNIQIIMV
jgi:two-component system, OmpR family, sensor histidine kinase KdpD